MTTVQCTYEDRHGRCQHMVQARARSARRGNPRCRQHPAHGYKPESEITLNRETYHTTGIWS